MTARALPAASPPRGARRVAAGLLVLSALGMAGLPARAAAAAPLTLTPCRLPGIERELRCGHWQVPADPDAPHGPTLSLRVAVATAAATQPKRDAIVVLAGGPGQAATAVAPQVLPLFEQLNAQRDIVFLDQRGTGASTPLRCQAPNTRTPLAESLDEAQAIARLRRCRAALMAEGHDLRQFATWIAARDIEAMRLALGYGPLNLWGASYGTRLALEYARQFPQAVRTLVLDGVAPASLRLPVSFALDTDAAIEALLAHCQRDTACQRTAPHLADDLNALLAQADRGIKTTLADPVNGAPDTLKIDRRALIGLLRGPLYAPTATAVLPLAITRARQGDFAPLVALNTLLSASIEADFAEGMHFSVMCAEDVATLTDADRTAVAKTRAGAQFIDQYRAICADWPVRAVPAAGPAPTPIHVPVLLLSGGRDPATPPAHATALARSLPQARHVIAPPLGHGVSGHLCAVNLIQRYIRTASFDGSEGDIACLQTLPEAPAFAPLRHD